MDADVKAVMMGFVLENGLLIVLASLLSYMMLSPYLDAKRKRLPPGPTGVPILGYIPFIPHDYDPKMLQLFSKYGSIFCLRIGSADVVFISDFELIKTISKLDVYNYRPDLGVFGSVPSSALVNGRSA